MNNMDHMMNMSGMMNTSNPTNSSYNMTHTGSGMSGMGMSGMGHPASGNGQGTSGMGMQMGNMSMGGMMQMYFHTGIMEYILFQQLHTHTVAGFAWACFVIFIAAFMYELLKYAREELLRHHNVRVAHVLAQGTEEEKGSILRPSTRMCSRLHILQTVLHGIQIFLSYCLMLVFMTYNVYLGLSVILGATLGYFLTGWKRTQVLDSNQHCE